MLFLLILAKALNVSFFSEAIICLGRVDGIDPALRRYGRFDFEIEVAIPTIEERLQILEVLLVNAFHYHS